MGARHHRGMPRDPAVSERAEGDPIKKPDRLPHLTKEAWRGFVRALQWRLAAHGVSFGHWTFLRILWKKDALTQRELADEAGVTAPTTAAAMRTMEELGYVTRSQSADNRKNVYVRLTPRGRGLPAELVSLATEAQQ